MFVSIGIGNDSFFAEETLLFKCEHVKSDYMSTAKRQK